MPRKKRAAKGVKKMLVGAGCREEKEIVIGRASKEGLQWMSTSAPKPSLQGVRIKARKGAVKAQAKHEPTVFRDQLLKHIATVQPSDYDALYERLVLAGGSLELLKYADELYYVLIIGGLLQPGGDLLQDGTPVCAVAVVLQPGEKEIKEMVEVFNKLIRRYKYLQKPLEESALPTLLQYAHKWPAEQRDKLAHAMGLMLSNGLITAAVLTTLTKEHLLKDDLSATVLARIFKAFLSDPKQNIDQLARTLRSGGIKDLAAFFPANKRDSTAIQESLKKNGVPSVAEWYAKRQTVAARDELVAKVKELAVGDEGADTIVAAIQTWKTEHPGALAEPADALVGAVWPALMASVDWANARPDQIDQLALKEITKFAPVLEPFCDSAKTQVGLINVVQVHCYEDTRLMKTFPQILKVLYNGDVVSDKAIVYWHQKGAKPQGKQHFLKATEALVKFLEEQESEEDEDE